MLILTRKKGEKLVMGNGAYKIVVTLLYTRGGQAILGIEAPAAVPVDRHEVWLRKQQEVKTA